MDFEIVELPPKEYLEKQGWKAEIRVQKAGSIRSWASSTECGERL
jgi:protease I